MRKYIRGTLILANVLGMAILTACGSKTGELMNSETKANQPEKEATWTTDANSTTDMLEEDLGWITHGGLSVYVNGAKKSQLTKDNEIVLNQSGRIEDGCYISFETLKSYAPYKDVKNAELWSHWFINLSDGVLLDYVDGEVGRSIYYMDERIPFGATETMEESVEEKHYYIVVWGTDESDTVMILSFPYEYEKEEVDKLLSEIQVKKTE